MPIADYDANTFVAYIDISGFKEMMANKERARKALNDFYVAGFRELKSQQENAYNKVDGLFVSDCGVLFVRNNNGINEQLMSLLRIIQNINSRLLEDNIMLTTSIGYGHFSYQSRLEFMGIEKNPIYGEAYVDAFLDNENGKPRIQPGQCRISSDAMRRHNIEIRFGEGEYFNRIVLEGKHYYFYWNVNSASEISKFKDSYRNAYKLKYSGMLQALKGIEA